MLAILFGLFFTDYASAGIVTNINNSGTESLRAAIGAAADNEVITFSPSLLTSGSATITLTSEISIPRALTITGLVNGNDTLYISGNNNNRIFAIDFSGFGYNLTTYLNNLIWINASGGIQGGAVFCGNGQMQVNSWQAGNTTIKRISVVR